MGGFNTLSLINISEISCKSCYKCVNSCSVKAIRMLQEKAEIIEDRCISCGNCLVICPQRARSIINDVSSVKKAIKDGKKVIASIAPSFAAAFDLLEYGQLAGALKKLGFSYVEETGIGAEVVDELYKDELCSGKYTNFICTSCPSVNYLIEKYYKELIPFLAPVVSPMIAHGKLIKKHYGNDSIVVFIGPCVAKKKEAYELKSYDSIDEVITFSELSDWIKEENINLQEQPSIPFDRAAGSFGKSYPLCGGAVSNLEKVAERLSYETIKVQGIDNCIEIFNSIASKEIKGVLVEANVCKGGCIGGPYMLLKNTGYHARLKKIRSYIDKAEKAVEPATIYVDEAFKASIKRSFKDKGFQKEIPLEKDIKSILKKMGKTYIEDELNCGGCGYESCRAHAIAIYQGMSEINMCFPYIRSKAESLKNLIFESSPNVIIILDEELNIKEFNPAAEKVFKVSYNDIKDKPISNLIDDRNFKIARDSKCNISGEKIETKNNRLILLEAVMYLQKQEIILAIMKDITTEEKNHSELIKVKENTLNAAQEVIDKQMRVAQEIASLLGETTAETKIILTKLKKLANEEIDNELLH